MSKARVALFHGRRCAIAALLVVLSACTGTVRQDAQQSPPPASCTSAELATTTRFSAQSYDSGLPVAGQWRDGFDLADMNGDGIADLLHGPSRKGQAQPVIFLGDGAGHFERWAQAHFPALDYDYGDVKAADFNGDGRMDFALAAHLRGLVTFIGEGSGNFAPWGEGLTMLSPGLRSNLGAYSSRDIDIVDWDRDGKPDLLAVNEGPAAHAPGPASDEALALFLNRNGYWERVHVADPVRGFGNSLAIGDIDGDGKADAMIGLEVPGARLLLQMNTTSAFASRELHSLPPNAAVTTVALQDFNRDGRADAVAATRAVVDDQLCTALQVVSMKKTSAESSLLLWREYSRAAVAAIAIGDIDGDGHADLIALRDDGSIMSYAGNSRGFTRDRDIEPPTEMAGCTPYDAKLADLDGNAGLELLVSYAGEPDAFDTETCRSRGGFHAWHLH